jgi:hypothetical protein
MSVNVHSNRKRDDVLIVHLAAGLTIKAAAEAAGLNEKTVRRRLADPAFRDRVNQARDGLREQMLGRLLTASLQAVATLEAMQTPETPATARVAAARALLENADRLTHTVDLAKRVADLEAKGEHRGEESLAPA